MNLRHLSVAAAAVSFLALPSLARAQRHQTEGRGSSNIRPTVTRVQPAATARRPDAGRPSGNGSHNWHNNGRNGDWCDRNGRWHRGGWNRWNTSVVFGGFGSPYGYGYGYYPYSYGVGYGAYYEPYYAAAAPAVYDGREVRGDAGNSVIVDVQRRLARAGLYHGSIDGVIGTGTRRAIRAYERAHGLPVDGIIDDELLATMGLA